MYHFLDLKLKIILPHDSPISVPKMTPLGTLTGDEIDDEYTVLILYLLLKNQITPLFDQILMHI